MKWRFTMKLLTAVIGTCALVSSVAFAQTPPQPSAGTSAPPDAARSAQNAQQRSLHDWRSPRTPDSCVGPASFCTPYFGN
jgi:hypothetical protein